MTADAGSRVLPVRELRIPMRDGVELAADLLLPDTEEPVPAVFQFFPYQKGGRVGRTHAPYQRYFAEHGYASLQVDFRGTGNSGGHNPGPIAPEERLDGHDVVEWLASQPWCSGTVGIWGISYGGITALSIASTRPPHLGAIIPIHATDDNFAWLFRPNGCRGLLLPDLGWGSMMTGHLLVPPLQWTDEAAWRATWQERLDHIEPWLLPWHGVPPDPAFWIDRRIPIEEIAVPTFGISAWHDVYVEPMLAIHAALQVPKRMLIGPWKHELPDTARDHPTGGAHEMTRWWDRWLKGVDNGVDAEPPFTIFVMGDDAWRHEPAWPPARTDRRLSYLGADGRLVPNPPQGSAVDTHAYDSRIGAASIGSNNQPLSLPVPDDQSVDDHLSLTYTGERADEDLEVTGAASVRLWISASVAEPEVSAKLCVVRPSGASRVIGRGWIDVARPDPLGASRPLAPGEVREVVISLRPTSFVVRRGDRLRLSVAAADFPQLWPTTTPYLLEVHRAPDRAASIEIPVVPRAADGGPRPALEPAARLLPTEIIASTEAYDVVRSLLRRELRYSAHAVNETRVDAETTVAMDHLAVATTDADAPDRSVMETATLFTLRTATRTATTRVAYRVSPSDLEVTATVELDGEPILDRSWHRDTTERDGSIA